MRRIIYLTTAVLFSLAACTKEESPVLSPRREILFSSGITVQTKTSVVRTDTTMLQTNGFRVAGIWKGDTEYLNGTVSYDSTSRKYVLDETRYWPSEGKMDFYAVFPKSAVINTDSHASPSFVYMADGETDLLTARASVPNQAVADLGFTHVLARMTVKCRGEAGTALTYKVTKVQVVTRESARFDFTSWSEYSSSFKVIDIYEGDGVNVSSGLDFTTVGGDITVFPTDLTLRIKYKIYQRGVLISEQEAEASLPEARYPRMGRNNIYQCFLSNNASEIMFTVTTDDWLQGSDGIEVL